MKIGLLIIATNKYINFLDNLIKSADNHFLQDHDVTYFVFSNVDVSVESKRNIVLSKIEHKPWPWMTLGRYDIFSGHSKILEEMDYLFYCDVDMRFEGSVGSEILSDRVATQHPGWYGTNGTPETRPQSKAYLNSKHHKEYFAGGFNGGSSKEFLTMSKILSENIHEDLSNKIIAIWHDESHMNRYFFDNPPTKILNPGYCYPESRVLSFDKKLVALDKNHHELRS